MEVIQNVLQEIVDGNNLKYPQGIKALKMDDKHIIFTWQENKIVIYEASLIFNGTGTKMYHSKDSTIKTNDITLSSSVIGIFSWNDSVFVIVKSGIIYSLQPMSQNTSSPMQRMEIDDIFSSPPTAATSTVNWKENLITKVENCDRVSSICQLSNGLAIVACLDDHLIVFVYLFPYISLKFMLDLEKYKFQEAVVSSCAISSLAPSLKQSFEEQLEVLDTELVVVGLDSGLVLWFCTNTPVKGPFVLCNTHQCVQAVHWIRDSEGLYTHLMISLSSGRVVIYGNHGVTNLSLPDSVNASTCLRNCVVSSNLVDCYTSELKLEKEPTFNSILLPVKGVSAMTEVPGSERWMLAATTHGSVYSFNPTVMPQESSIQFVLPDQSILDNMFVKTQELEKIYEQLNKENETTKAVSVAMAVNSVPNLFQLAVKVTSENDFTVVVKLKEIGFTFSREIWLTCVEIAGNNKRQTFVRKLSQDLICDSELKMHTNHNLAFGEVVTVELLAFLENKHPLLVVPLGKVVIDSCHLMSSQISNTPGSHEALGNILHDLSKRPLKKTSHLQECKLVVNIPIHFAINSCLPTILHDSQHRISEDDWNKISDGKKFSIQVSIQRIPALLQLELGSRMLTISCRDIQLCYQIKESVLKRLENSETKHISEHFVLDIQALYQSFEIESLRDELDFKSMDVIRQKLRSTISPHLPI